MSQEHVDLIRWGFEAFNRGDWDAALELVAEDVVWGAYLAAMDGERAIYGHESLRRTWQAQRDDLGGDDLKAEARDIRDLGAGSVLVKLRVTGRGSASGVPVQVEYVQLWTIRGGRVVRLDNYASEAEALEAAGLSE
jgi:ketosteroid isomerase-like protein